MCRDKDNYHSVSVRNKPFSRLENLTKKIVPGMELSRAKVVEKLINDKFSSLNPTTETINEYRQQKQKI
jgi:hypothetical protein